MTTTSGNRWKVIGIASPASNVLPRVYLQALQVEVRNALLVSVRATYRRSMDGLDHGIALAFARAHRLAYLLIVTLFGATTMFFTRSFLITTYNLDCFNYQKKIIHS